MYYLKKALDGDKQAREILLGNNQERYIYIGDETPLWLVLSYHGARVVEP